MHYYKRNLGDYAKKAGRLSMLQHGAYTLLIDTCYDREQFPTLDEAIDWAWASSAAEVEAVEFVLRKFFVLEGDRYVQKRIQEELLEYRAKSDINTRIAQDRETKRREQRTERARSVNEAPPNQEPITNTPSDEGVARKRAARTPARPAEVAESVWQDFQAIRKAKRAPLTDTALEGIRREAAKAGLGLGDAIAYCCEAGWQGFNAGWYADRQGGRASQRSAATPKSFAQQEREAGWARWEQMTGRQHPDRLAHEHGAGLVIDAQASAVTATTLEIAQ